MVDGARAPLLELDRASVSRGGRIVLHDLSLRVESGERLAIVGPNGCGKSTLLKLLTRECYPLPAGRATMRVFGRDRWNVFDLRRAFGIVSADLERALPGDASVLDIVVSGFFATSGTSGADLVTEAMRSRALAALERLGMLAAAERQLRRLSSGQMRRVTIARALVTEPRTLVLDEPTTSLDLRARAEVLAALRELSQETGVLLVTHDLAEIDDRYTRVIGMRDGRFVMDGARRAMLAADTIGALFGVPVRNCETCDTFVAR